jgi:alkaline phosphatase D
MTDAGKRDTLKLLGLSTLALPAQRLLAAESVLTRIAFGSCLHQDKPQPIWDAVLATQPDLFIFLGDNIYGDSDDPAVLAAQYAKLAAKPGFQRLRATTPVLAIWDDHDFGRNDAGAEYPAREASRALFMDFWNEAADSVRRTRPDGIYTSQLFGPVGQRVQVILPDLRWNRSPLNTVGSDAELTARTNANMGPYAINHSPAATLLGEAQWRWLEAEFRKPADVRIFSSSIQALANYTGWEAWANFPAERERLLRLLDAATDSINLVISGDVHWCEYSLLPPRSDGALPLAELTSSGLTETWEQISPNEFRRGTAYAVPNFGLIEITWDGGNRPVLQLSARTLDSSALFEHRFPD